MTISVATSEDLASVHRRINTLSEELGKTTALVAAVNVDYGEAINALKARIAALDDAVAHPLQVAGLDPERSPDWGALRGHPVAEGRPAVAHFTPMPGIVPFIYSVSLDDDTMREVSRFIRERWLGREEKLTVEEALRRIVIEGLRSARGPGV